MINLLVLLGTFLESPDNFRVGNVVLLVKILRRNAV